MSFLNDFECEEVDPFPPRDDTINKPLNRKLHFANSPEIVNILLLKGAHVNNINSLKVTPLHSALRAGRELSIVRALLLAGADVNAVDHSGRAPLHSAIIAGAELPVIKAILSSGADVNAEDTFSQFTALHFANTEEIVHELVLHSANVNALAMSDGTPLLFALFAKKNLGVIKALLSAKADVNCKIKHYQYTPLHYAHTEEITKELLAHGADVNALDLLKKSPLHSAVIAGRELPVIKALLSAGAHVNAKEACSQFTALHLANTAEIVHELVLRGADVNARDMFGGTPLHFGTFANKDVGVIKALLSAGADVNCKIEHYQHTPLYYASTEEITKELLTRGADVNALGLDNNTPLHSAIINGRDLPVIKAILSAGADVNAEMESNKFTALHYADTEAIVNELICNGADTNVVSRDGETPLHLAIRTNKDISVIKALLSGRADPNAVTTARPIRTAYNIAYRLLFHGSDAAGYNGETPLVSALYSNAKPEVIKLLLLAGAEVRGHTLLHKCTCPETASLLISYGADVNERDEKQNTALHTITTLVPAISDALKVIHLLLKSGADVNARNSQNELAVESDEVIHYTGKRKLKLLADFLNYGLRSEFRFNLHIIRKTRHSNHFIKMLILTHYDCYKELLDYNIEPCHDTSPCSCNQWVKYFEKCEREVVRLKKYRLYNNFSLFNLVVRKPIKPLCYSTRLAIIVPKFPIYKRIIKNALSESSQRALLREMFNKLTLCCWLEGCGDPVVLTFDCMNSIANYLNDHDILKFITAMSSSALINNFALLPLWHSSVYD